MIYKEKANLRLLVYDEVRLIVGGASSLLPLDKSYHHPATIIIHCFSDVKRSPGKAVK